ncbi:hypothetical protein V6N12_006707 [Hibiscus sabdariffa]|uniref:Uncharacterized protein n=1 Tax=Hibiscus sabdariffa TaxID=183260 RepID=A0ABR2EZK7_9ROSI
MTDSPLVKQGTTVEDAVKETTLVRENLLKRAKIHSKQHNKTREMKRRKGRKSFSYAKPSPSLKPGSEKAMDTAKTCLNRVDPWMR